MDGIQRPIDARVSDVLRLECRLIAEAVRFVASGATPRVTVAGLRFGDALLQEARDLAVRHGVRVVPRWPADEAGLDVTIERQPQRGERSGAAPGRTIATQGPIAARWPETT